jgi:hypothetical protein
VPSYFSLLETGRHRVATASSGSLVSFFRPSKDLMVKLQMASPLIGYADIGDRAYVKQVHRLISLLGWF